MRSILARPSPLAGGQRRDVLAQLLAPRTDAAYTLLRVVTGVLFAFHGYQKLFDVLMPVDIPVGSQVWFGGRSSELNA